MLEYMLFHLLVEEPILYVKLEAGLRLPTLIELVVSEPAVVT